MNCGQRGNERDTFFLIQEILYFEKSDHFSFNKNQTTLRVIEGYDVVETDKDAYEYLSFEEADEKTIKTLATEETA